ncbi:MAG: penicillin-binding protein 1A [Panacagrimonas sp.]
MSRPLKILLGASLLLALLGMLGAVGAFYTARWYYEPDLPDVDGLDDLQLQVPLRIYSRDGKLIGEFGAERRTPLAFEDLPQKVIDAFLAAEDARFFEHPGVDWQGIARAAFNLALTGEKSQGGSTITMQLARNVFLSSERTYERKIKEIFLALRIERELSKEKILETYLNKIFLGQRAYGVAAASRIYFGKQPEALSWGQAALLAGLPKAPSRDNPVSSAERARERRDYVLGRLIELGKISELEYRAALGEPVSVRLAPPQVEADAHYAAEMARAEVFATYGQDAYTRGLVVTTTIDSNRQDAANRALRSAINDYSERHGWRGPETRLPKQAMASGIAHTKRIEAFFADRPPVGDLVPAIVVSFSSKKLQVLLEGGTLLDLPPKAFAWARLSKKKALEPGDVVRVRLHGESFRLAQVPEVQGALVALNPKDGALEAVAGGYDFLFNKFNRVTQAQRQPGSGFKPLLYAAAFDAGFTPASVLLDAPVVFGDALLEDTWRPSNYDGKFKGPMRLREALVHSRNLISIRLLQEVGIDRARNYIARFGIPAQGMPRDLSMSLGSGSLTPLQVARAYAVFANGGYLVAPYLITSIHHAEGDVLFRAEPATAGPARDVEAPRPKHASAGADAPADDPGQQAAESAPGIAPRVIEPQVAWLVSDILREVTVRGTAARARALKRNDIAGKTGTSNDEHDAWFNGYNGNLVAVSWLGFDQPAPLGRGEVGGRAALPMWMDFMRVALKDEPQTRQPRPPGLVTVRIDRQTGMLAGAGQPNALLETVQADHIPQVTTRIGDLQQVSTDELF